MMDTTVKYWNASPEEIIKIERMSDAGIWVVGKSGKRYVIPHHIEGEAKDATLRIVGNI